MVVVMIVLQWAGAAVLAYSASSDARFDRVFGRLTRANDAFTRSVGGPGADIPEQSFRRWSRVAAAVGAGVLGLMALATTISFA